MQDKVLFLVTAVIESHPARLNRSVFKLHGCQPRAAEQPNGNGATKSVRGWDGFPFEIDERLLSLVPKTGAWYSLTVDYSRFGARVVGAEYLEDVQVPVVPGVSVESLRAV